MNEELLAIFCKVITGQISHCYRHYHEMIDEHGEEAAREDLERAIEMSAQIDGLDAAGIRPSTFAEDLINAGWPYTALLLDLEEAGAVVVDGEQGERLITIPGA